MDRPTFDAFCKTLPATFMVEQWGHAHVWKVGNETKNKVFALSSFWTGKDDETPESAPAHGIIFKVAPLSFELLTEAAGIAQAPYFAKGQWVRVTQVSPLSDDDIAAYVREAHRIMASQLTKKLQAELGLETAVAGKGAL
ncbi:MAG: MmcQ/YjbR family DNA-binding protein [Pseudomonadota bacterium]